MNKTIRGIKYLPPQSLALQRLNQYGPLTNSINSTSEILVSLTLRGNAKNFLQLNLSNVKVSQIIGLKNNSNSDR